MVLGDNTGASTPAFSVLDGLDLSSTTTYTSGPGYEWKPSEDGSSYTLTLSGVVIQSSKIYGLNLPGDNVTIILEEGTQNYIRGGDFSGEDTLSYGICKPKNSASNNLTIQGSGSLTAIGGTASGNTCGIYANGDVIISGSAQVTAIGGNANYYSYGIFVYSGNISIVNNAQVTAIGGTVNSDSSGSYGISADGGSLTISGAKVTAIGGTSGDYSCGILASLESTISDAQVTAIGGTAAGSSHGIYASSNMAIAGSAQVTAIGGIATGESGESCGISADGVTTSDESKNVQLTAIGGTASGSSGKSNGIEANEINLSGGLVIASSGDANTTRAMSVENSGTLNDLLSATNDSYQSKFAIYGSKSIYGEALITKLELTKDASFGNLTDNHYAWDSNALTLTLKNLILVTTDATALSLPDGATIVLEGINVIRGGDGTASYGIHSPSDLTIKTPAENSDVGSLYIFGGTADDTYGIFADSSNIEISGNAQVTAIGGTSNGSEGSVNESNRGIFTSGSVMLSDNAQLVAIGGTANSEYGDSDGIFAENGMTITGSTQLMAIGGTANGMTGYGDSDGICAHRVEISGSSQVMAIGGTTNDGYVGRGIFAYVSLTIKGEAQVTAIGGTVSGDSYGIHVDNGSIILSENAQVTAIGGTANISCGISANDHITISENVQLTAIGGTADVSSYGVHTSSYNISIPDGSKNVRIMAVSGTAYGISRGIYLNGGIIISDKSENTQIIAIGGTTNGEYCESYGIFVDCGSITISGSTQVTAVGGIASGNNGSSYGIGAEECSITISGSAQVTAVGGTANSSYGIYIYSSEINNLLISGSAQVTATGSNITGDYGGSYGIYARNCEMILSENTQITAIGGTVNAKDYCESYGIYINECNILISNNAQITATGSNIIGDYGNSYGIYAKSGSMTIKGGTLIAKCGTVPPSTDPEDDPQAYGLYTSGTVTVAPTNEKSIVVYISESNDLSDAKSISDSPFAPVDDLANGTDIRGNIENNKIFYSSTEFYSVTYAAGEGNGDVPIDPNCYLAGVNVIVLSADDLSKEGHVFKDWKDEASGKTYKADDTFTMPAGNVTLTAEFELAYNITYSNTTGGTISGVSLAAPGSIVTITVTTDTGHQFKADSLKGTYIDSSGDGDKTITFTSGENGTYTFIMPDANVTLTAEWTSTGGGSGSGGGIPINPSKPDNEQVVVNPDGSTTTTKPNDDGTTTVITEKTEEKQHDDGTKEVITEKKEESKDENGNIQSSIEEKITETVTPEGTTTTEKETIIKDEDGKIVEEKTEVTIEDETTGVTTSAEVTTMPEGTEVTSTTKVETNNKEVSAEMIEESLKQTEELRKTLAEKNVELDHQIEVQVNGNEAELPADSLSKLAESNTTIKVSTNAGTLELSPEASKNLAEQGSEKISLSINEVDKDQLNERQQEVVGDAPVFDLNAKAGEQDIHDLGGTVTITVPYELKDGEDPNDIAVFYVDDNGNIVKKKSVYDPETKTISFETDHFSYYFIAAASTVPTDEEQNNTLYYLAAAVVIILVIAAIAFWLVKKKQ